MGMCKLQFGCGKVARRKIVLTSRENKIVEDKVIPTVGNKEFN